ncbi:SDR family oxidoreductase [Halogranum rubrum]|uniref:dTDP-4-dehydrorhamnose reductase n=1 Tax=Halogranum salarium B-1 TaxID=1210908 RepID=J2ZY20_9EURY|nr:SDR family oxidoreductase [Halogranum salarium]EJN57923.1 dTDP-4-dehydrorhamnose reductase [Halogranum salarium B-1]
MKILVVGADGLLGSNVVATGLRLGHEVVGTTRGERPHNEATTHEFDVRNATRFRELLDTVKPDFAVNCAAMTDVDRCESEAELANEVNARAPAIMAERCTEQHVGFVHISTDYVFDGTVRSPYDEAASPNPIQAYGETKLRGDRAVLGTHEGSLVVRPSFVYGIHRGHDRLTGFPAWVRDQLQSEPEVSLFTDQWVTPTRAGHAATVIFELLDEDVTGVTNVASRSCVTPFEFGTLVQEHVADSSSKISSSTRDAIERPATRPQYTCLDVSRVEELLDRPEPTLVEDLAQIKSYIAR